MRNTAFLYVYQDAAGHVNPGLVVFAGVFSWKQKNRLANAFASSEHFIASQIKVPEVFFWSANANCDRDEISKEPANTVLGDFVIGLYDHCWHQYVGVELIGANPTDKRNVEEFVADVEFASHQGWDEFDPWARVKGRVLKHMPREN